MIFKIDELKAAIEPEFNKVEINSDLVLRNENTAVIYAEELEVSFETVRRKKIEEGISIIFNVKTTTENALGDTDLKLDSIVNKIIEVFDSVLRIKINMQYVESKNMMFVQMKFFVR